MFPAQTVHRWDYGTGCWLFALESPRRWHCSRGVQNALGDKGEERRVPVETTAGEGKERVVCLYEDYGLYHLSLCVALAGEI